MNRYHDIIFLSKPVSFRHASMPRMGRAAQFAPFAALSGFGSAVDETARLTQREIIPDDEKLALMDEKMHALLELIRDQPEITITYFEPDSKKSGGAYLSVTGQIRRIDDVNRQIFLTDRTVISMDSIYEIDCALLPNR